ncbi:MAG: hypothetical protein WHT46_03730 [Candidatus Geothermincolales bacterium]
MGHRGVTNMWVPLKNLNVLDRKGKHGPYGLLLAMTVFLLLPMTFSSCGSGEMWEKARSEAAVVTARDFLDACGEGRAEEARGFLSPAYLEENQVPDPLGEEDLEAAMGRISSYRLKPEELQVKGNTAMIPVYLQLEGEEGEREEFISLEWDGLRWTVTSFTAMDWRRKPLSPEKAIALAEARSTLQGFLADCIDHRTDRVFASLSSSFRERYRVTRPWTREEFSGIFGKARSYRFDPGKMTYADGSVEVDVTIEFGSPGNLEEQTSRVRMVWEEGRWKVDSFPFFLL